MTQHHIDKKRAQASFNKASALYEDSAVLQKQVLEEMFLRLKLLKINPISILDLGCGPGNAGPELKAAYKPHDLIYLDFAYDMLRKAEEKNRDHFLKVLSSKTTQRFICADMEAIPLAENSVDMVWSNLSLQWCNDLDRVFTQIAKTLTHNITDKIIPPNLSGPTHNFTNCSFITKLPAKMMVANIEKKEKIFLFDNQLPHSFYVF